MVSSRVATAVAGVVVSLIVSVLAWWYFNTLLFFLVVPFVPFLFRRKQSSPPVQHCPVCGYQTRNPEYTHCPRDGTRLETAHHDHP